jgi:VWFA-related protein
MIKSSRMSIGDRDRGSAVEHRVPGTGHRVLCAFSLAAALSLVVGAQEQTPQRPTENPGFRFKSGVELINVTATVSDANGRFVPGLRQDDFSVFDDEQPVTVTHFNAERVPVSLGIALDTSGSMAGDKIREAQSALDRFLYELLAPQDEIFIYRFSNYPVLLQDWTSDRLMLSRALSRLVAAGGTAMYDAVGDSVPLMKKAQYQKKALVIISDGRDTSSRSSASEVRQQIRESETLVYAIGLDCVGGDTTRRRQNFEQQIPTPLPFPMPGSPRGRGGLPRPQPPSPQQFPPRSNDFRRCDDPVDVAALRDLTDDSGGRTEIIRDARDLNPATAGIADELSKQYYLGYAAPGTKDGRWHTIRVELKNNTRGYRVRARRGYNAS